MNRFKIFFVILISLSSFSFTSFKIEKKIIKDVIQSLNENSFKKLKKYELDKSNSELALKSIGITDSLDYKKFYDSYVNRLNKSFVKIKNTLPTDAKIESPHLYEVEYAELDNKKANNHSFMSYTLKFSVKTNDSNLSYLSIDGLFKKEGNLFFIKEINLSKRK